ncbi:matrixin family metalloprotease [Hyalangium versicolor]|uniref:matrixin family metalloprotease n=1 Tax=Hyalangium versicolor TaxID=2861190 RepID=UPI001CCE2403|nr:matrixin family metalloprotease [Hyalangium versicolor]
MRKKLEGSILVGIGLLLVLAFTPDAQGYTRFQTWWNKPVVRAYACPNLFAQNFPNHPWANIRNHLLAALNEWFVTGGVDLRVRLGTDLAASDARCVQWSGQPLDGEILVTSEQYHGGGACNAATTFTAFNGSQPIIRAKLIMHSGTICNGGVYSPYSWAQSAQFPNAGELDFWTVFLHEVGHAIGFDHSSDSNAVMWPTTTSGENVKRKLSHDELAGLRDPSFPYAPTQTTFRHRYYNPSAGWLASTEPYAGTIIGQPSACWSNGTSNDAYLVAATQAQTRNLVALRTDGFAVTTPLTLSWSSFFPPVVGCHESATRDIMLHVSADSAMTILSSSVAGWTNFSTAPLQSTGQVTQNVPALAYASFKGWYVMAYTHRFSGKIHTLISKDQGQTWGTLQQFSMRTFHPMGLTCQDSGQYCVLAYTDGNVSHTPVRTAVLRFDASGNLYVESDTATTYASYGAGVAAAPGGVFSVWRDRGTATVLTHAWWLSPSLGTSTFSSLVLQSPPTVVRTAGSSDFTAWSSFSSRYDQ